jgi:hypothetical protein
MSVGMAVSKSEIDTRAGDITRGFQKAFDDVLTLKSFLDDTVDTDLVALGYTQAEVTLLKSAFADLATLTTIWTGTAAQSVAYDFRTFVKQLWGVGSF